MVLRPITMKMNSVNAGWFTNLYRNLVYLLLKYVESGYLKFFFHVNKLWKYFLIVISFELFAFASKLMFKYSLEVAYQG